MRPHYGGQALIEGVMMRSPNFIGAAVRRKDALEAVAAEAGAYRDSVRYYFGSKAAFVAAVRPTCIACVLWACC